MTGTVHSRGSIGCCAGDTTIWWSLTGMTVTTATGCVSRVMLYSPHRAASGMQPGSTRLWWTKSKSVVRTPSSPTRLEPSEHRPSSARKSNERHVSLRRHSSPHSAAVATVWFAMSSLNMRPWSAGSNESSGSHTLSSYVCQIVWSMMTGSGSSVAFWTVALSVSLKW